MRVHSRAVAVLAATCLIAGTEARAQAPQRGTLLVNVPRGMLPSQDYWLYVDHSIVSAPPHGAFASLQGEFMRTGNELWDAEGRAAAFEGDRLTFARPGLRSRIFERQQPIRLAPGKHVVELLTRAANKSFPFAITRIEVELASGKTSELELGVPPGTEEMRTVLASRCTACGVAGGPTEDALQSITRDFDGTIDAWEKLPLVAVLNDALLELPLTPTSRPSISVALPDSSGGGRELDARQLTLIIDGLATDFRFPSIEAQFKTAEAPVPELAALLELKIAAHNKRVDAFRRIVTGLEQARRH